MERIWQKNIGAGKLLELECEVSFSMRLSVGTGGAETTAGFPRGARAPGIQSFNPLSSAEAVPKLVM